VDCISNSHFLFEKVQEREIVFVVVDVDVLVSIDLHLDSKKYLSDLKSVNSSKSKRQK